MRDNGKCARDSCEYEAVSSQPLRLTSECLASRANPRVGWARTTSSSPATHANYVERSLPNRSHGNFRPNAVPVQHLALEFITDKLTARHKQDAFIFPFSASQYAARRWTLKAGGGEMGIRYALTKPQWTGGLKGIVTAATLLQGECSLNAMQIRCTTRTRTSSSLSKNFST